SFISPNTSFNCCGRIAKTMVWAPFIASALFELTSNPRLMASVKCCRFLRVRVTSLGEQKFLLANPFAKDRPIFPDPIIVTFFIVLFISIFVSQIYCLLEEEDLKPDLLELL